MDRVHVAPQYPQGTAKRQGSHATTRGALVLSSIRHRLEPPVPATPPGGVPPARIAAVFEARCNVAVDIAGQAIKSRNSVVLKGGRMLARTDTAIVDLALRPAAEAAKSSPCGEGLFSVKRGGFPAASTSR